MTIRTCPGKAPLGGFVAAIYDTDGAVIADAWGFTKWEAKQAVIKLARQMGVRL